MHSRQFITDNFKFDKNEREKLPRVTRKMNGQLIHYLLLCRIISVVR